MKNEEITDHVIQFIADMKAKGAHPLNVAHSMYHCSLLGMIAESTHPQALEAMILSMDEAKKTAQEALMKLADQGEKH